MSQTIQQNRYDRLLRRVAGMIGAGSKVSEVVPDLLPTIDVENVPGELLWPMDTRLSQGGGALTAAALEFPTAQVRNPDDSNLLITVTSMMISCDVTCTVLWGAVTTDLSGFIVTQVFRDNRGFSPSLPAGVITQVSSPGPGVGTIQLRLLANTPLIIQDPNGVAVLPPSWGLRFATDQAASTINYGFFWRERVAEQSELLS